MYTNSIQNKTEQSEETDKHSIISKISESKQKQDGKKSKKKIRLSVSDQKPHERTDHEKDITKQDSTVYVENDLDNEQGDKNDRLHSET